MSARPLVVSVHALETGGGDGLVADAGVVADLDGRTACVATSVVPPEPLPLSILARQLEAVIAAGPIDAVRIGYVRGADQAELIAHMVARSGGPAVLAWPLKVGGETTVDAETRDALIRFLYPAVRVVVARAADLAALSGRDADDLDGLRTAATRLRERGAKAVVIAGWLKRGRVLDLIDDDGKVFLLDTARVQAPRVFGLAGAYAAALAAHLARGLALSEAADAAQRYIGFRLLRGR